MGNHALLSASSSHRWLNCPPSARLGENYEDRGSDFAAEGTDAHSLCEHKLKTVLGIPSEDPTENLTWYNEEMEECASGYAAYVLELLAEAKKVTTDPIVLIEQRLDYSKYVESGFGTGDCVLIADGTLNIVDYKHGKGVEVSADHNPQMMLYALGALEIFDALYDIDTVTMTIYQPRRSNVSTHTVSTAELLEWAETVLKPTAELAFKGEGEFHCGEWCRFCKAKADCRECARANLALAAYDFAEPPLLTDEETIMSNNTTKVNNPMKVITGKDTRWSYANVWEAKSINGGAPKFSVSLIIPKSDTVTVQKIKAAIEAAYHEGEAKLKGNGKSVPALSVIKNPLRDGDTERPDDPAYAGCYFVNANSTTAPGIVDADRNPILVRSEVYSGVYGRASINFYAFNSNGNRGIACGLNNLQKIRDGEPLGGKASAESDFDTDDDDDFLA